MSNKNGFIHNWNQTKKVGLAKHQNITTAQIGLTHLFLLSSVIASEDLMGLNLYIFGDLTDFLVEQDCQSPCCFENIKWHSTGHKWCGSNHIFTFF